MEKILLRIWVYSTVMKKLKPHLCFLLKKPSPVKPSIPNYQPLLTKFYDDSVQSHIHVASEAKPL